ncbi:hypothetical protein DL93DRAFT_2074786 [Clavulina sp. PMI_390]|nr:hypothetical protein DL93DRAFT_2074786 [Clavulina sp. PMI_390]
MDGIGGAFGDFMRTYRALYLSDTEKWHKELDVAVGLCVDGILKGALQILQQPQTFPSGASSSSRSPTSHALANQTIRDALAASASLVELYRPPSPLDDHAPTRATWTSHWSPFVVAMGAHVERLFRVLGSTPASPSTPYSRPSHRLRTVSGSSIGKGVVGAGTPPHRLISRPSMTSSAGGSGSGSPGSMFTFHSVQHVPAGSTSMSSSVGAGSAASSATEAIDTLATLMRTYRTLWKAQPSPSNSSTALASSSTTSYFPSFKSSRPPFTTTPSASSSSTSTKIPRNLLASSLEALSARLFRVRRPTEACAALNEIVDMYRSSYARDPMNHHVSLAEALAGWGDGLSTAANTSSSASGSMAKWMEACKASEEVVEMYRRHVARDSKTFHALFAKALEAHSERLKKAAGALAVSGPSSSAPSTSPSQRQSMLTSTHSSKFSSSQSSATTAASLEAKSWACRVEIVDFYRGLDRSADLDPGVYHREIAASLNACADALASSGLVHEACDAALEVVEYYRAVAGNATAHTGVGAGLDELRRALEGYAGRLERAGRVHDAVDAIGEIVGYERERFERHPEAHAVGLAEALDELAWRMARAGRLDEAVAHAREAVRIDREWKTFSVRESEEKKQACFERVFACAWYLVCLARRGRKTGAAMGDSSSAAASLARGSREFPLPLASPNSTSMPFALPALNASMSTIHIPFASKSMSASISMSMSSSTSTFARPSRGPELSSHSLSTVTPAAHFHASTSAEYYLEVLSLIGPALETLRALRHIHTLEESLHPERYWMNEEEARLRRLVKDVLSDCAHDGVEIAEEDIDAVARGGGEGEEDQDDQYYQQTEQSHSRSRSLSKTITQSLSRSLSRSRSQSPSRNSRGRNASAPLAGSRGPGPPVTKGPVRAHGLIRTKSSSSAMSTSSQNDSPPLRVRPRRNSSSAASMKTRLGWEINRWRAQKASEARTQPWF